MSSLSFLLQQTQADHAEPIATVQSLWSGYGDIVRYRLQGSAHTTVIAKHIRPGQKGAHPRHWNTDVGHQRKLRSYEVETAWYQHWAQQCTPACRVPACLGVQQTDDDMLILLEDLDAAGFAQRRDALNMAELMPCLDWLAQFHAQFLNATPTGLWPTGTYWHLATRPDELANMAPGQLKEAAAELDRRLHQARYQTLVHGDAKVANFCFSDDGQQVAAVDFQYVGGGCGMKDVAYFLGSCLSEAECERHNAECLDHYFATLRSALHQHQPTLNTDTLEQEWRHLFPLAWADFTRFLLGWMPTHRKLNRFSQRMTQQALASL